MNCKNCNNTVSADAKFCGKCGKNVLGENLNEINTVQLLIGNKNFPSVVKRILKVILIIFFVAMVSQILTKQRTVDDGWIGDIINILTIFNVIAFFTLLTNWWKNRKTNKKWFNKKWIILLIILSMVSFLALVFSQALVSARLKSLGLKQITSLNGNWVGYNSPDNTFSVEFPLPPAYDTKIQDSANGKIQTDTYKSANETGLVIYSINVTKFPLSLDFSDSNDILGRLVDSAASDIGGKIITSKIITQEGYPAMDYLLQGKTISKVRGLNILVGQNIYQLITFYNASDETKLEFEKFINSFKLK